MGSRDYHEDVNGHAPPLSSHDYFEECELEAIAVIGFSLKFPQDAVSPASFWRMLEEKRCAMTEWPRNRINLDSFYHPDNDRRDTVMTCPLSPMFYATSHSQSFSLRWQGVRTRSTLPGRRPRGVRCFVFFYHSYGSHSDGSSTSHTFGDCLSGT